MFGQSEQQMQGLKPGMNLVSSHQGKKASVVEAWEGWGGKMILEEIQGIGKRWIVLNLVGCDQELGIYSECDEKLRKGLGKGIGQSNLFFQITLAPM